MTSPEWVRGTARFATKAFPGHHAGRDDAAPEKLLFSGFGDGQIFFHQEAPKELMKSRGVNLFHDKPVDVRQFLEFPQSSMLKVPRR